MTTDQITLSEKKGKTLNLLLKTEWMFYNILK